MDFRHNTMILLVLCFEPSFKNLWLTHDRPSNLSSLLLLTNVLNHSDEQDFPYLLTVWEQYCLLTILGVALPVISVIFTDGLAPSKENLYYLLHWKPLMKIAFYFILKALFVFRYLSFCHDLRLISKNVLIRKVRLTSKFMTSQPG